MTRYAVLFPGQASQHEALLPWLEGEPACAPLLQALAARLGTDWRARLRDADWRSRNAVAQLLVTGTSLAAWAALAPRLPGPPAIVAGYSVGELAAYACAGVIAPAQALELAARRAALMDEAVRGLDGGMLSVSGLAPARVEAACAGLGLAWAIDLGPDQGLWAGPGPALDAAAARLAPLGAECKRLPIGIPSHAPWMAPAAAAFGGELEAIEFARPRALVAVDAGGDTPRDAAGLKAALSRQMDHRVDWAACLDSIAQRGVRCVVEVGAGTALARLWAKRFPEIPVRGVEEFSGPDGLAAWVERQLQAT